MKSNLLSLTVAALLCCTPFAASARDTGRGVGAQFDSISTSKVEFKPIVPSRQGQPDFGIDAKGGSNECQWHVLNIPVLVGAAKVKVNDKKVYPNFVPAITFHVYLLIDPENAEDETGKAISEKKKRAIMLDKEITYVDIPLKKAQNTSIGEEKVDVVAHINVGVFLSPNDITRIMEKDTSEFEAPSNMKKPKILALAMDAQYNGAPCWVKEKNKDEDIKVDGSIRTWGGANWWKKKEFPTRGAKLMSINETPFAASFYPSYCATRPMYGSAGSSASSPSSLTPISPLGDPKETTAADAAAGDDTAAGTSSSGTLPGSGTRKPRKGRGSRN